MNFYVLKWSFCWEVNRKPWKLQIKIPVIPELLFLLRSFLKGSLTAYQSIISSFVCLDCQQVGHVNKEACVYVHFSLKTLFFPVDYYIPMMVLTLYGSFRTYSKTNIHRLHCLINITRQLFKSWEVLKLASVTGYASKFGPFGPFFEPCLDHFWFHFVSIVDHFKATFGPFSDYSG